MTTLTNADRELVAIGAAVASNCVPCVEYHIPEARRAGLTDSQIAEAVTLADRVRQVPARKVWDAAMTMLQLSQQGTSTGASGGPSHEDPAVRAEPHLCCGTSTKAS